MRKLFFLALAFLFLITGKITAKEDNSFLIRRVYLDVIGVVPTIEEIDWYLVYNTNGYVMAVDFVLQNKNCKWNIPKNLAKMLLLSNDYKIQKKRPLLREEIARNLFYVVGMNMNNPATEENIKIASLKLIDQAIASSNTETDIIDYMSNCLMSRSTNLVESNIIEKLIKDSVKSEKDTWLDVLNVILNLEDVKTK